MSLYIGGRGGRRQVFPGPSPNMGPPESQAHEPVDVISSRHTRDLALIAQLEQSTQESYETQAMILQDLHERTAIIKRTLKMCRDLRLMMVYVTRGEVSDTDKDRHKPPKLHKSSEGGASEAEVYIQQTLDRIADLTRDQHQKNARLARVAEETQENLADRTQAFVDAQARDDDDLTIVSNWNRFSLD